MPVIATVLALAILAAVAGRVVWNARHPAPSPGPTRIVAVEDERLRADSGLPPDVVDETAADVLLEAADDLPERRILDQPTDQVALGELATPDTFFDEPSSGEPLPVPTRAAEESRTANE